MTLFEYSLAVNNIHNLNTVYVTNCDMVRSNVLVSVNIITLNNLQSNRFPFNFCIHL